MHTIMVFFVLHFKIINSQWIYMMYLPNFLYDRPSADEATWNNMGKYVSELILRDVDKINPCQTMQKLTKSA